MEATLPNIELFVFGDCFRIVNLFIMTQLIVTLENGANSSLLRKMIENMKGVLTATFVNTHTKTVEAKDKEWINKMMLLSNSVDSSVVDLSDERTQYILSK